jgi:amino acid adenylation domain-containing protein
MDGSVVGAGSTGAVTPAALSFAQRRLWFLDRLAGNHLEYLDPIALRLRGPLNASALRAALRAIVARHTALRTRYVIVGSEPHQVADDVGLVAFEIHDLNSRADDERQRAATQLIDREVGRPFDLAAAAPVRITLIRLSNEDHILLIVIHHIATDAWSRSLLARELREFYDAFATGTPVRLPKLVMSYAEFARWQRQQLSGTAVERLSAFWQDYLAGLQPLDLPTDYRRRPVRDAHGGIVAFGISPALYKRAASIGRQYGATPFMIFLGAYVALLHRYTGQHDIAVGTPAAGRGRAEVEDLIGCFANMLVIRTDLSRDPCLVQLLARVRDTMLRVHAHGEMPFELLVSHLSPQRDLSVNPLFQHAFAWQNTPLIEFALADVEVEPFPIVRTSAKFDLTLRLIPAGNGGLSGEAEYTAALYERATVQRLTAHYVRLLEQAVASPDTLLSQLDLLTSDDRVILRETTQSGVRRIITANTVHRMFEQQAARSPNAIAVRDHHSPLTYDQLNRRANRLARMLRTLGVSSDTLVGIIAEPGIELITGLIATLKAGGAYLPVDPNTPVSRTVDILTDARPAVLITQRPCAGVDHPATVVLDRDQDAIDRFADDNLGQIEASGENLAYVIYTSGSTGRPKGVMITHKNVVRLFTSAQPQFRFGSDDVWTLFHSAAFDFSVWEIWGALLHGGELVIVPPETARSPARLLELVTAQQVTILNQTPSAFRGFVDAAVTSAAPLTDLRLVVLGGEAVNLAELARWFDHYGDSGPALANMYGITETTVHVTAWRLSRADVDRRYCPVGKPLPDLRVYLLDGAMKQAPVGIPAEIYVGGAGLARGYLNRPALTAERFVADPFSSEPGGCLYRTGDLARLLPDGTIEYVGRIDDQVKIRGFRIELGEVEAALNTHPAVALTAVTVYEAPGVERHLVAYVVWNSAQTVDPAHLRAYLAQRLPGYMVPASYVTLPALPRTVGGKLDRRALPEPDHTRGQAGPRQQYIAPRSLAEILMSRVWTAELGLDRAGVEDDFFEIGGDSIRAVRLVGTMRAHGWPATVEMIFQHRTVTGVLQALESTAATVADVGVLPFDLVSPADREQLPADVADAYPLAMTQLGMLFEMDANRDTRPYHNVVSYPSRDIGGFQEAALRQACAVLVKRHEILRTSFDLVTYHEPMQLVHRRATPAVTVRDLRQVPPADASRRIEETRQAEAAAVFDIGQRPLLRLHADVLGDNHWVLTITESHAILDGWSHHFLVTELLRLYREFRDGQPLTAPKASHSSPTVRFADFIALERAALDNANAIAFWSERISEFERLRLPVQGNGTEPPGSVRRERIDLRGADQRLRDIARIEGLPLKTVLLTAHMTALAWFTGKRSLLTGLVCNGRPEVLGGDQITGMFLNTVPFGVHVTDSWRQLMRAVYEEEIALWPYRRYPLPAMQQRWGGGQRLLPALFSYQDFHVLDREMIEVERITKVLPMEFTVQVTTEPGALVITGRTDEMALADIGWLADLHRQALKRLTGYEKGPGPLAEGAGW